MHKLNSRSIKLYNEVFYVGKKYPHWAGYSMGYYIVKNYLKKLDKIDWTQIFKISTKNILKESGFLG